MIWKVNINKRLKYSLQSLLHLSEGFFSLIQNRRCFGYGFWYPCTIETMNNYFLVYTNQQIQDTCRGFKLDNFDVILMLAEPILFFFNWTDTSPENQSLYWFCMNALVALFTLISRSWNFFVSGTITILQLFLEHNSFRMSLSWPLNVSMIIKECCCLR